MARNVRPFRTFTRWNRCVNENRFLDPMSYVRTPVAGFADLAFGKGVLVYVCSTFVLIHSHDP